MIRPNKKLPVFRVGYLNLLAKPVIFSDFLEKNIILCILKGRTPFKMHKIIYFFPEKKLFKKCVPSLPKISRSVTRNTPFFLLA